MELTRVLQWLGWDGRPPRAAIELADDAVRVVAVRDRPVRVTAHGSVPLDPGVVRRGDVRLVGVAAEAARALRRHLHLPQGTPAVALVRPDEATGSADGHIRCRWTAGRAERVRTCVVEAGFGVPLLDPVPAALARLARHERPGDLMASGAGWLVTLAGDGVSVERSAAAGSAVQIGTEPARFRPLDRHGVLGRGLEPPSTWLPLIGAALADPDRFPTVDAEPSTEPPGRRWVADRVDAPVAS